MTFPSASIAVTPAKNARLPARATWEYRPIGVGSVSRSLYSTVTVISSVLAPRLTVGASLTSAPARLDLLASAASTRAVLSRTEHEPHATRSGGRNHRTIVARAHSPGQCHGKRQVRNVEIDLKQPVTFLLEGIHQRPCTSRLQEIDVELAQAESCTQRCQRGFLNRLLFDRQPELINVEPQGCRKISKHNTNSRNARGAVGMMR